MKPLKPNHRNHHKKLHCRKRKSAFEGKILRLLRNEIQYELERFPPEQVGFQCFMVLCIYCKTNSRIGAKEGTGGQEEARGRGESKKLQLKEAEEKIKSNPEFVEVKNRLSKLAEVVNEIVIESKKQSSSGIVKTLEHSDEKKHPAKSEPRDTQSRSGLSSSVEKVNILKPTSGIPITNLGQEKVGESLAATDAPLQDMTGKANNEGPSEATKR